MAQGDKLVLRYRHDEDDDFGWLSMSVVTEDFSGSGGFWVQWQDVVEFGKRLECYPIQDDKPIVEEWGYTQQDVHELVLSVSIAPKNSLGELRVSVVIADHYERANRLSVSFRSGYPALELFRRDIDRLMKAEINEAVLHGY